jgi:gluconate 2-dehydrogenase gamma chain
MAEEIKRKEFVTLVGVLGAGASLAAGCTSTTPGPSVGGPEQKALVTQPEAFTFFTPPEQMFIGAACDRIIPGDAPGPSASDAGVPFYIDQQLAGAWGNGARQYRQGPWREGTPEQGYQLAMLPKDVYRTAIRTIDSYCTKKFGSPFAQTTAAQQDEVLTSLEKGTIDLGAIPAATFFGMLLGNTIEGYFADPLYGGNRDKAGWKLIGFPGVAAAYNNHIEDHNMPYTVAPVSISDVQQGLAADDMDMPHVAMVRQMHPHAGNGKRGR